MADVSDGFAPRGDHRAAERLSPVALIFHSPRLPLQWQTTLAESRVSFLFVQELLPLPPRIEEMLFFSRR